jgi:GT2 family glycosyltransferase
MLWQNNIEGFDTNLTSSLITASCNKNLGVWARFAYALNASTEYVCIFDDDTIPGNRWLENCLNTIQTHNGLLGTAGIRFKSK